MILAATLRASFFSEAIIRPVIVMAMDGPHEHYFFGRAKNTLSQIGFAIHFSKIFTTPLKFYFEAAPLPEFVGGATTGADGEGAGKAAAVDGEGVVAVAGAAAF